jgi:hypothetical protein
MFEENSVILAQYIRQKNTSTSSIIDPALQNGTTSFNESSMYISVFFLTFFLLVLVIALIVLKIFAKKMRREEQKDYGTDGVLFEVSVPQTSEVDINEAEKLFSNLYSINKKRKGLAKFFSAQYSISFEIVALPGEIRFFVYAPKKVSAIVEKQILGTYQDASINIVDNYNIFDKDAKVAFAELNLSENSYQPLRVLDDFHGDPLSNILSTVSKISEGEGVLIQYVITPADKSWQRRREVC